MFWLGMFLLLAGAVGAGWLSLQSAHIYGSNPVTAIGYFGSAAVIVGVLLTAAERLHVLAA